MLGGEQNQPKMTRLWTIEKKGPNQVIQNNNNNNNKIIYIYVKFFQTKSLNVFFFPLMYHILSPYNMIGMKMITNVFLYETK